MEEITVNRIDGVPFWGHGTLENLQNGITPDKEEVEAIEENLEEPKEKVEEVQEEVSKEVEEQ